MARSQDSTLKFDHEGGHVLSDPQGYLKYFWPEEPDSECKFILKFLHDVYATVNELHQRPRILLEVGGGPVVDKLISASRVAQSMIHLDASVDALIEVSKVISGNADAFDWTSRFNFIGSLEHTSGEHVQHRFLSRQFLVGEIDLSIEDSIESQLSSRAISWLSSVRPAGEGVELSVTSEDSVASKPEKDQPEQKQNFSEPDAGSSASVAAQGIRIQPSVGTEKPGHIERIVSSHSVAECITTSQADFEAVFRRIMSLCQQAGDHLVMTINTDTKEWSGGEKAGAIRATPVSEARVMELLKEQGFDVVLTRNHRGEEGEVTAMPCTLALWAILRA